ncbi:MAG TPA: hypothetical protein VKQ32_10180 [Polyangia bacterium]|nr:hypothetical protein [Polyangia bacterium]
MNGAGLLLAAALGASAPSRGVLEPQPLGTRYLRLGETAELSAVLVAADGRRLPLPPETETRLRWFEARPEGRDYDNVRRCHGRPRPDCADPIAYRLNEIARWRGRARIQVSAADVGLGSHRYAVTLGAVPAVAGDAIAAWPAIVVRRDDTYTGYLTELVGTPFVFWPTAREVDERLGADCVALVIYGRRRLGRRVPYVSPRGLEKLTARVAAGRFPRDRPPASTPPLVPVRVGDIVHFGFQTAVVVEDRPPLGVLTEHDVIIHSFHGVAEQVPLGEVPYAHFPFEVRRWKD